ncbi:helix-turn-helix domain-containing protein [Ferruginibacter sp.]
MVFYFVLSIRYYQLYKKLMVQVISYADAVMFKWVKSFLLAFLLMQLLQVAYFLLALPFPKLTTYVGTWWYFFSFALIFYYIAITGYSNSVQTKVSFKLNLISYKPSLLLQNSFSTAAVNDIIEDAEVIEVVDIQTEKKEDISLVATWKPKILELLEKAKVYEDPELSLTQVAKQLGTNPSLLSKVINQGFQLNFNDFINNYRIEAVKEKLKAGEHKMQTLLGIAYDCGFNSKATFNRAFKKATGVSPKEWQEKLPS